MSPNSNISFRSKADVLEVFHLHSAKLDDAAEALNLLKLAMHQMGADEALRAVLSTENAISDLMAGELVENAMYGNLLNAERHVKDAQDCLDNFIRIFRNAHAIYASKVACHA